MISLAQERNVAAHTEWQDRFLQMLPAIKKHLQISFRELDPEAREEAVQEGMVNCLRAFLRLYHRGRAEQAFPSSQARFVVKQVRSGRQVACRLNVRDPLSRHAQLQKGVRVERLDRCCRSTGQWFEPLVEDQRASIPDQVALRIDFPAWLATLSRRNRRIAKDLAVGNSTRDVARKFKLSSGRISQLRSELFHSWNTFHGEQPADQQIRTRKVETTNV